QQVVRIDHETRGPFGPATFDALAAAVRTALRDADVCIISDYGKGVVTPELVRVVVEAARSSNTPRPVVVDPKRRDFAAYAGATVITPNLGELEVAVGRTCGAVDDIVEAARGLLPQLGGGAIL